ncbi:hypothetical protein D478_03654 [Brevibacillus agri BAB-2500]|nr:hypothetical protein D478_03654 [Brevibacillus agri BAB-2500]
MTEYYIYLDESTTHNPGFLNPVFCLAGIVVKKDDYHLVQQGLDKIKQQIWYDLSNPLDLVLHEKEVREAQNRMVDRSKIKSHYLRFRSNSYSRMLYSELDTLLKNIPCNVLGAVIRMDDLDQHFKKDIQSDYYLSAMQIVMENFCQFLINAGGIGHILIESRSHQDKQVRLRYNHIKAMGSMFVNPFAMQTLLKDIDFPSKTENIAGLQIADFVPNPFARNALGNKQPQFNIYQALRPLRYDGGLGKFDRFGMKIMP